MSKTSDALAAVTITAVLLSGWAFANRPRGSHAADLHDLLGSPICLAANGSPQPAGPTLTEAWQRTFHSSITQGRQNYIGSATIELGRPTGAGQITFVRAGSHRWRPNDDVETLAWLAIVCPGTH